MRKGLLLSIVCLSFATFAYATGSESSVTTYYSTTWSTNGWETEDCDHQTDSSGFLVGHWKVIEYTSCTTWGGWTEYYERCGASWVYRASPVAQCGTNYETTNAYYDACPAATEHIVGFDQNYCNGGYNSTGTLDGMLKVIFRYNCDDISGETPEYFLKCNSSWVQVSNSTCTCP